jgi:hypothetical protein
MKKISTNTVPQKAVDIFMNTAFILFTCAPIFSIRSIGKPCIPENSAKVQLSPVGSQCEI